MKYMIFSWLISAGAFMLCTFYVPGFHVNSLQAALTAAALLGVCNAVIRPVVVLFMLPLTIATLGLSLLFVNTLMLYITAHFVPGVSISNFLAAFVASIVISVINTIAGWLLG